MTLILSLVAIHSVRTGFKTIIADYIWCPKRSLILDKGVYAVIK